MTLTKMIMSSSSSQQDHDQVVSVLPTTQHLTKLCYASSLSYFPLDKIPTTEYYKNNISHLRPIAQIVESTGTESGATIFLEEDESNTVIVVACRGSATIRNFVTNLRFKLVPISDKLYSKTGNKFEGGRPKVHEGFLQASEGLWEQLEPMLTELLSSKSKSKPNKVIFTGHSLGGGTAELCALHYALNVDSSEAVDVELVTFAGPLLGDVNYAQYFNDKVSNNANGVDSTNICHIVHDKDPILANNGPLWAQLGFKRSGIEFNCDPYTPTILNKNSDGTENYDEKNPFVQIPPWNIIDHCNYLGLYVGPRI